MAATPHCGGPAHLYLGNVESPISSCRYLGACEETPAYSLRPRWVEIVTDSGGSAVGEDEFFAGETGVVTLALTLWDDLTLESVTAMPVGHKDQRPAVAGRTVRRARGTLSERGRGGVQLVIQNQLYNTPAATPNLKAGIRFHRVGLDDYGLARTDTGGQLLLLQLSAWPAKTKANEHDLYDFPSEIEQLKPDIKIY